MLGSILEYLEWSDLGPGLGRLGGSQERSHLSQSSKSGAERKGNPLRNGAGPTEVLALTAGKHLAILSCAT